jgi:hypothetical protein
MLARGGVISRLPPADPWNVDPHAWTAWSCRVVHRNLARTEWCDFVLEQRYRAMSM